MEGSAPDSVGTQASWLRCYRCWSQNLEVQVHYEGVLKVDPETAEAAEPVEEIQEAVVQCLDCLHDQPHLNLAFYEENGRRISRIEAVEDRWERMVAGTPWVASCTVSVDGDQVESCSGPEAADSLAFGAFGDHGTREFFTHVRFHKHDGDQIVVHMLVELYARSAEEAAQVMEDAARGPLTITSLAEESRPPAATSGPEDPHKRSFGFHPEPGPTRSTAAIKVAAGRAGLVVALLVHMEPFEQPQCESHARAAVHCSSLGAGATAAPRADRRRAPTKPR